VLASLCFGDHLYLAVLFLCCHAVCPSPCTLNYGGIERTIIDIEGSYNASTQSVTQLHRLPARWLPDLYQNWTRFATSEQTTPAPHAGTV